MSESERPFRWLGCAVEEVPEPAEPPPWLASVTIPPVSEGNTND